MGLSLSARTASTMSTRYTKKRTFGKSETKSQGSSLSVQCPCTIPGHCHIYLHGEHSFFHNLLRPFRGGVFLTPGTYQNTSQKTLSLHHWHACAFSQHPHHPAFYCVLSKSLATRCHTRVLTVVSLLLGSRNMFTVAPSRGCWLSLILQESEKP